MSVQYGKSVLLQQRVNERFERFNNGRTSVKCEEGAGRLSTSITGEKIERVRDLILHNRRVAVFEVANPLEIIPLEEEV